MDNLAGFGGLFEADVEEASEQDLKGLVRRTADKHGDDESWDASMKVRDESVDESSESRTVKVEGPEVLGSMKRGIMSDVLDETKRHGAINVTAARGVD